MSVNSSKSIVITDRVLRSWIRCRRKAWLDRHANNKLRIWPTHRSLQVDHQHRSYIALITQSPHFSIGACEDGASFVLGLNLKGETPSGKLLKTNQPLLQKVKGISKWGEFSYRPVITRQGYKLTREHKLTLALNSFLLEKLQQTTTNQAIAISQNNKILEIENFTISSNLRSHLLDNVEKITEDLNLDKPPSITANKRKCSICCWKNYCHSESVREGHLGEVSGIGGKRLIMLKNLGIKNIKDLANSNPIELEEKLIEPHKKIAPVIIKQALVQISQQKERLNVSNLLNELKSKKGVLLYDIESDPDDKHNFLHGFVKLAYSEKNGWDLTKANYQPLLNLNKGNEEIIWKRIKRKLESYSDWPILHYGETERLAISQLGKKHGCKMSELDFILKRFIDMHIRVKESWILPLNNYGLKTVSNYIGYNWETEEADGSKALLWWRQWKNSKRSKKAYSKNLNKIFKYNRDDCLATWAIASWLLDNN